MYQRPARRTLGSDEPPSPLTIGKGSKSKLPNLPVYKPYIPPPPDGYGLVLDSTGKVQAAKLASSSGGNLFDKPLGIGSLTVGHGLMGAGVLTLAAAAIGAANRR